MGSRLFDLRELIELCEVPGVSGREERVREKISTMLGFEKDKLKIDKIGNLVFEKNGFSDEKQILLMAHMDEIGFYVSSLRADGKLEVRSVGGIIEETLPGSFVQVFTKTGIIDGVIGAVPPHLKADGVTFERVVDVGAKNRDELAEMGISVMDYVVFRKTHALLNNDYLAMRSLDDRFGCYTLIEVSRHVYPHSDVVFAWTVQEEVGLRGAKALAYQYNPDLAIAIDSFACCSRQNAHIELGKGPVIRAFDNSSISDYEVVKFIVSLARKEGIPLQIGVTGGGNDASVFAEKGVPLVALSVPVRYLHSQVELISLSDLHNLLRLLRIFLEVF